MFRASREQERGAADNNRPRYAMLWQAGAKIWRQTGSLVRELYYDIYDYVLYVLYVYVGRKVIARRWWFLLFRTYNTLIFLFLLPFIEGNLAMRITKRFAIIEYSLNPNFSLIKLCIHSSNELLQYSR